MNEHEEFKDDDVFVLTEWGCLACVLNDYNVDVSHITGRMGKHLVNDFMEMMCESGYAKHSEKDE